MFWCCFVLIINAFLSEKMLIVVMQFFVTGETKEKPKRNQKPETHEAHLYFCGEDTYVHNLIIKQSQ